jgi:endonuclease III-like uncharacterized protein
MGSTDMAETAVKLFERQQFGEVARLCSYVARHEASVEWSEEMVHLLDNDTSWNAIKEIVRYLFERKLFTKVKQLVDYIEDNESAKHELAKDLNFYRDKSARLTIRLKNIQSAVNDIEHDDPDYVNAAVSDLSSFVQKIVSCECD